MQYRGFFEDLAAAETPSEFDALAAGFVILRLWQQLPSDRRDIADTAAVEAVHRAVGAVSPRLRECAALDAAYAALTAADTGAPLRHAMFDYAEIIAARACAAAYDVFVTIATAAEQSGTWGEARRAHLAAAAVAESRGDAKTAARHQKRAGVAARVARAARKGVARSAEDQPGAGEGDGTAVESA